MKLNKQKISAIVISKNEEERIGECLKALSFADEVVVVDNGSVDRTVEIAKRKGAKVINLKAGNFSELRNIGAKEATGKWLLYIDADERVTLRLKKEILQQIQNDEFSAYAIPRRNILLGREMRYGGWWPDYVMRLIKKDALKSWRGELHEQPEIRRKTGKLKNPLIHNTHRNLTNMVAKTNEWSEIEARLMYKANHPKMNIARFLSAMFREFWYRAIAKKGFLDGPVGIIEIIYQIFSRFVSYAKLWEMQLDNKKT